jgi:hypothetical protein
MGYPCHELIYPAILLDHPGITADKFETFFEPKSNQDVSKPEWGLLYPQYRYFSDLKRILNLQYSQEYIDFTTPKNDTNGIPIDPPYLEFSPDTKDSNGGYKTVQIRMINGVVKNICPEYIYSVTTNTYNEAIIQPEDTITIDSRRQLAEGDVSDGLFNFSTGRMSYYLVKKVISEEVSKYSYTYNLTAQGFYPHFETEYFATEEDLFRKWPQFKPENMFDLSQMKGHFSVTRNENDFLWKCENGRYYLDDETYNLIHSGHFDTGYFGYIDLILTSEAIKHRAWKLFGNRGIENYLDKFLKDFPEVIPRYEKSIWDSHTSIYAKEHQLTHNELIRLRIDPKMI